MVTYGLSHDLGSPRAVTGRMLDYLAQAPLGRIALSVKALPVIFPVNHLVWHGDVVFMTGSRTKLAVATTGTVVAFEVDHFDHRDQSSWSVLVQGVAEEIIDPDEAAEVRALPFPACRLNGEGDHFVRIRRARISGRQFQTAVADDHERASVS